MAAEVADLKRALVQRLLSVLVCQDTQTCRQCNCQSLDMHKHTSVQSHICTARKSVMVAGFVVGLAVSGFYTKSTANGAVTAHFLAAYMRLHTGVLAHVSNLQIVDSVSSELME